MRVVLAEDSGLLREVLTGALIDRGVEVVAAVPDAEQLLRAVESTPRLDAAIVDVRMPPTFTDEGLRAALVLRKRWPDLGVLILSQYVEERYATELLAAGARGLGYLLKDKVGDLAEFSDSLARVAAGGTALDPGVVTQLVARSRHTGPLARLTPRERDVLAGMAEGRSNAGIAAQLFIGEGAVEKHVTNIFAKLDLGVAEGQHRRVQAVLAYLRGDAS
ncbi:MAG: response regulator transcription factor [Propioniciclava sp.]|uniref:LuxR C-terminal-related transcriptional regulator n=1 Tax=Propioniciclava sp. TaxID=2038686 RepID=UPI0039E5BBAE